MKTWMIEVLDTPFLRLTKIILEEKWHFFNYFFKKMPILYENGCTLVMFYINRHPEYTMDSLTLCHFNQDEEPAVTVTVTGSSIRGVSIVFHL